MPDQETTIANSNDLSKAAARRKVFRDLKEHRDQILRENEKDSKKFCRYLRSKRNRITKIAPIHEETEDFTDDEEKSPSKSYCLKIQSCWQANENEKDIYQTQTKIHKQIPNYVRGCQKTVKQSSSQKLTTEIPQKVQEIQTISGALLQSSIHYQVSLRKYGSLIETQHNINAAEINSPPHRKCPRLKSFYWLFRPFHRKYRKSKPKIQAVVYKTYFVKWTKPPDTLIHGYGIKTSLRPSQIEVSVLRRCRSATF